MIPHLAISWLFLTPAAAAPESPAVVNAAPAEPAEFAEFGEDYDLTELSLEELMDIEVTIATREAEPLSSVPAAVYVLTGDEIRRSGHSSIPEALRMVPGFHVSRWTTGAWDVTSRGFGNGLSLTNAAYLNQLLVMIDGVVVYTPLFAGVWWPIQDLPLEDIDRIEIVRGPGGALWGSNAVHGVVHIITKNASETQGFQIALQSATDDRHAGMRYGGTINEGVSYRGWVKVSDYDSLDDSYHSLIGVSNDWYLMSFGARFDWEHAEKEFSLSARGWDGNYENLGYDLDTYAPIQVQDERQGGTLVASMADPEAGSRWQAWFATDQQDLDTLVDIKIDTFDLEYQKSLSVSEANRLNIGAGFRHTSAELYGDDPYWYAFTPDKQTLQTYRVFAMDTIKSESTNTALTMGATAENNSLTGFEFQPTVRGTWSPEDGYVAWAAVSRAVRTPSLEEDSLNDDSVYAGRRDFRSETLYAYEIGFRAVPTEWVAADLALYYNDYDHVHYRDPYARPWGYELNNEADGESYGGEIALDFHLTEAWKVRSAYSYHGATFKAKNGDSLGTDEYSPMHAWNVRSYYDIWEDWEFDVGVYGVEGMGEALQAAEYIRVDARLGWRPFEGYEVYVGVQGATEPTRSELDVYDHVRRAFLFGLRISP